VGCRCLVGLMVLYNNTCCAMAKSDPRFYSASAATNLQYLHIQPTSKLICIVVTLLSSTPV
jgi:hypothetical protein